MTGTAEMGGEHCFAKGVSVLGEEAVGFVPCDKTRISSHGCRANEKGPDCTVRDSDKVDGRFGTVSSREWCHLIMVSVCTK